MAVDARAPWRPPTWFDRLGGVSWRLVGIVVALAIVVATLGALSIVLVPFTLAVLAGAALAPLHQRLLSVGAPPSVAAGVTTVALLAGFAGCGWLTVELVIDQWTTISAQVSNGVDVLIEQGSDALSLDPDAVDDLVGPARGSVGDVVSLLLRGAVGIVSPVVRVMTTVGLALFVLFFLLKDGAAMWTWTSRTFGDGHGGTFDRAGRAAFDAVARYMRAQTLVAAIDAALIGLGAAVLGVPNVGAIALVTFFAAYIPYIGAIGAGALAVLLALAEDGLGLGIWMLVVVLAVQQIEGNVLQPMIQSRSMRIHPLVVALAMVVGGAVGGFFGLLVAIPVVGAAVGAAGELDRAGFFGERSNSTDAAGEDVDLARSAVDRDRRQVVDGGGST